MRAGEALREVEAAAAAARRAEHPRPGKTPEAPAGTSG